MVVRTAANVIEGSRRAVHEAPDSRAVRTVLLVVFYGAAVFTGFGVVLLGLAYLLSSEDSKWT